MINSHHLDHLFSHPCETIENNLHNHRFNSWIAIPHYSSCIEQHYKNLHHGSLKKLCEDARIPYAFDFKHFGFSPQQSANW